MPFQLPHLGIHFFQELGRIIGQRVLAIMPQPQLEFSFMANASLDNGSRNIINAINTGTSVSMLNADGTFNGKGQGILRTEDGNVATWTNQVVGNLTREGTMVSRGVGLLEHTLRNGRISFYEW
jgi:hypothetical protein